MYSVTLHNPAGAPPSRQRGVERLEVRGRSRDGGRTSDWPSRTWDREPIRSRIVGVMSVCSTGASTVAGAMEAPSLRAAPTASRLARTARASSLRARRAIRHGRLSGRRACGRARGRRRAAEQPPDHRVGIGDLGIARCAPRDIQPVRRAAREDRTGAPRRTRGWAPRTVCSRSRAGDWPGPEPLVPSPREDQGGGRPRRRPRRAAPRGVNDARSPCGRRSSYSSNP